MKNNMCVNCDYHDLNRRNLLGQIRCKRFSTYVDSFSDCDSYKNEEQEKLLNFLYKMMRSETE